MSLFPDKGNVPEGMENSIQLVMSTLELRHPRQWGACFIANELWKMLGLSELFKERLGDSRKGTRWRNVSVSPPVIFILMLLLFVYNIKAEQELMETLPLRLDWLWFLGYHIDDEIPNNSVLSKTRIRWGVEAFKYLFDSILLHCIKAGLVNVSKAFVYKSIIDADASVTRYGNSRPQLRYKTHRVVDEKNEIITATKVTTGTIDDGTALKEMITIHQ